MYNNPLLNRYHVDQSTGAATRLMEAYYPLVYSVCRRYLRRPQDVEDASQKTFVKLLRHAGEIQIHLKAWLTTTAASTSIDLIRRQGGERRRREHLASNAQQISGVLEHRMLHQAICTRLHEALLQLDTAGRELLIDRFVRKTPLRVIAGQQGTVIGTISRRVSRAVSDLAAVLRDMGIDSADDLTVAEHFGDPTHLPERDAPDDPEGLRFSPDWRSGLASSLGNVDAAPLTHPCLPGWSRPIRVGAFVSYATTLWKPITNLFLSIDRPVRSLDFLCVPGFELVGIVERGTTDRASVERTLRQYNLTGGLIDASDREGLETLDVILMGVNFVITPPILHAINQAVRSGVGLLKEYWLGISEQDRIWSDPEAAELLLADSPVCNFHVSNCFMLVSATVQEEHPLMPNLQKGSQAFVNGCGPVYRPAPQTRVLATKNYIVSPQQHGIAGLGPIAPPAYLAGQLGRGRVVVVHAIDHGSVWAPTFGDRAYLPNLFTWLAEPRRDPVL